MKNLIARSVIVPGLCALALVVATAASAEETKEQTQPKAPSKAELKKYDANGDGKLDEAERAQLKADAAAKKEAAKQAQLEKYDADKDGKLSKEEKAAAQSDRKAARDAKKAEKKD